MRVVGGSAKGRPLESPSARGVRPTSALVRGAVFNILGPDRVEGKRVLDLFAGTGALGIEALSRGAVWADFVDRSARQCAVIRRNLRALGFDDRAGVHCVDVLKALETLKGGYDLVLMDPPYRMPSLDPVLRALGTGRLLNPGAVVVVGHSKRQQVAERYGVLVRYRSRRYGDSQVDFFAPGEA